MSQRYCDKKLSKRSAMWGSRKVIVLAMLFSAAISGCGKQAFTPLLSSASTPSAAGAAGPHKIKQTAALGYSGALNSPPTVTQADRSTAKPLTVAELVKLAGKPCETSPAGLHCMSEGFDFELAPDCVERGYYAGVSNPSGASLVNGAPPKDTIERAVLAQGQLACVQIIARPGKTPSHLFVTAIPSAKAKACSTCGKYGARKVVWRVRHDSASCLERAAGRYEGGCAMGWVDSSDMELMGKLR
jgi:hypothetical protein